MRQLTDWVSDSEVEPRRWWQTARGVILYFATVGAVVLVGVAVSVVSGGAREDMRFAETFVSAFAGGFLGSWLGFRTAMRGR